MAAGVDVKLLGPMPTPAVALMTRTQAAVAGIVWGTTLSQGLFYGDEPRVALVQLGPVAIWREGVQWGLVQSLRLVAVTLAGLAVIWLAQKREAA